MTGKESFEKYNCTVPCRMCEYEAKRQNREMPCLMCVVYPAFSKGVMRIEYRKFVPGEIAEEAVSDGLCDYSGQGR